MARPSPVPPYLRVMLPSACVNFSKIAVSLSASMPAPVSLTAMLHLGRSGRPPSMAERRRHTHPRSVNLSALDSRLAAIWRTRSGSPMTLDGRRRIDFEVQRDFLLRGARLEGLHAIVENRAHIVGDVLDHHLAGFDLGKIQNVVQQSQQGIGRTLGDLQLLALFGIERAVQHHFQHAQQSVHGRAQFMRHVGQELALGLAGGERGAHGFFQVFGALADAFFEQIAVLADLFLRRIDFRDHLVEAFAQIFDLVVRGADLDRLEFSFADGRDTLLQKGQRTAQGSHGESRNQTAHAAPRSRHIRTALGSVEGVAAHVPKDDQPHHPQEQQNGEARELGRQRTEIGRLYFAHVSMVPFSRPNHHWK